MLNFATVQDGGLPPLTSSLNVVNESGQEGNATVGWPVMLLPTLDNTALLKRLKRTAAREADGRMILTDTTELRVFKCPASPQSADSSGTLNYVINAGFIDRELYYRDPEGQHEPGRLSWDGNDLPNEERDAQVGLATGVCWRENNRRRFTFDDVQSGDGTAHTLLFTENLQAGPWQSTDTEKIGFGVPVSALNGRIPYGPGTQFESIYKPLNTSFRGSTISSASSRDWLINAENAPGDAPRPRPSSNHQGGVNAVFCDGHVQFLSETIDPHVYVKLVTSNGAAFGENAVPAKGY